MNIVHTLLSILRCYGIILTLILFQALSSLSGNAGATTVSGKTIEQSRVDSTDERGIWVIGDSLSAEYGITRGDGWVALLEKRLHQKQLPYRVKNLSVSGETTATALSRWSSIIKSSSKPPAWVILELGANDGLRGLSLMAMQNNLSELIRLSTSQGSRVLLVGMQIPPNMGKQYADQFQAVYTHLALRHRIPLVPFLLDGFAQNTDWFQPDRIHPLAKAQPQMLDNVWRVFSPLLSAENLSTQTRKKHSSTTKPTVP